jgi:tRNA pseudouridine38-40 synthase
MGTVRLDIAYHGAGFSGWATQPGRRTVQGELEGALERLLGERPRLAVAGRTDTGVHAWGQVASFEAEGAPETLTRSLNGMTGEDLTVLAAGPAPDGFDARRDARSRTYCYRVQCSAVPSPFERGLSLWWPHRVEREALDRCAAAIVGTHDFRAFTPGVSEHTRFHREVLRAEWRGGDSPPFGQMLEFWIEADAFMRNMVRVLVGTMLDVAAGRRGVEGFELLLDGAPREAAGETARAHGLYLASVRYEGS